MSFRANPWRMFHLELKMKRILGSLLIDRLFLATGGLFLLLATTSAHADGIPAFSFTSATFATDDSSTAELGYAFTTGNNPILVGSLGYINDGFNGTHVVEIFNQKNYHAVPIELQAVVLWAVQNNYFDKIPVDKVKDFQTKLTEYLTSQQDAILAQLREKNAFDDGITAQLKTVIGQFAETYA